MAEANGSHVSGHDEKEQDPTVLSTELIMREIKHLRELIEARLDQADKALVQARNESEKSVEAARLAAEMAITAARVAAETAISAALDASKAAIAELDVSITRRIDSLKELTDSKFITHVAALESQTIQTKLALTAAEKAIDAAFASSKEAINKQELYSEKRFDLLTVQLDELKETQTKAAGRESVSTPAADAQFIDLARKVDALAMYRNTTEGKSVGMQSGWGYLLGAVGLAATIISVVVVIVNLAVN